MNAPSSPPAAYSRRAVWAWALYDFANSAFTTLVVTFIYATFFSSVIAEDSTRGQALWSYGIGISALAVALLSPIAGAIADRGGYRKRFMVGMTVVSIGATVMLAFPGQGEVLTALFWFTIANVAFEMGIVFNNAFLPDLAPPDKIGRVSGFGWGLGYMGGLLCLVIALVLFVQNPGLLGLDVDSYQHIRATNILVAVWFGIFTLPAFFVLHEERPVDPPREGRVVAAAFRQFRDTFQEIRRYRQAFRLLVARIFYNDGLVTVIAFGAIYAEGVFDFSTTEILTFGIALNVAAGLGAWLFGFVDDKLGGKRTVLITVAGLTVSSLMAVLTPYVELFWAAGILTGLMMGPNQSSSRSLMGRFVPPDKENEFFGFFAFSGKATAFIGPLLLGWITTVTASQRLGVSVVIVLFVAGGLLLAGLDEAEGIEAAHREDNPVG